MNPLRLFTLLVMCLSVVIIGGALVLLIIEGIR